MTLENTGRFNAALNAERFKQVASEEDIEKLIQVAGELAEAQGREPSKPENERRRIRQREERNRRRRLAVPDDVRDAVRAEGYTLDGRGGGATDLMNDRSSEGFGEDQSDYQNWKPEDKRFADSAAARGNIAFRDPTTKELIEINIPDGVSVDDIEELSVKQKRALKDALANQAVGAASTQTRWRPKKYVDGKRTNEDIYLDPTTKASPRLRNNRLMRDEDGNQLVDVVTGSKVATRDSFDRDGNPVTDVITRINDDGVEEEVTVPVRTRMTRQEAEAQGLKFQKVFVGQDYDKDNNKSFEPTEPRVSPSASAARSAGLDAAARLRADIEAGRLSLDTEMNNGQTVGQLLARLEGNKPGKGFVNPDRAAGLAEVQRNRRIARGLLTPEEREAKARGIMRQQEDANFGFTQSEPDGGFSAANPEVNTDGRIRGTLPGGERVIEQITGEDIPMPRLTTSVEDGIANVATIREALDISDKELDKLAAMERVARRKQRKLDRIERIIPGKAAFVKNEGQDDARALTLAEEGAGAVVDTGREEIFALDGVEASSPRMGGGNNNADGMQLVKLNDYRIVDPEDPRTWRGSEFPVAQEVGLSPGRFYLDADGNILGEPDPLVAPVDGSNDPGTRQVLNVPESPTTVQELAARTVVDRQNKESMRQVGINPTLDNFVQRYNKWAAGMGATPIAAGPRSLADLQGLVDSAIETTKKAPKASKRRFYEQVAPGKSKRTNNPNAKSMLQTAFKLTDNEVGNLVQALTMLEAARDTQMPVDATFQQKMDHRDKEAFFEGTSRGSTPGANPGANNVAGEVKEIPDRKPVYGFDPNDPSGGPRVMGVDPLHSIKRLDSTERMVVGVDKKGEPIKEEVGPKFRDQITGEGLLDEDPAERKKALDMARSNEFGAAKGDKKAPVVTGPIVRPSKDEIVAQETARRATFKDPNDKAGLRRQITRRITNENRIRRTDRSMAQRQRDRRQDNRNLQSRLESEAALVRDAESRSAALRANPPARENFRTDPYGFRIESPATDTTVVTPVQAIREAPVVADLGLEPSAPTGSQPTPAIDAGMGERASRGSVARRALTERGPRISAIAQGLKDRDSAARQEAGLERLRERDAINNRRSRIAGIAQSMRDEANIFDRADESTALAERRALQERRAIRNSDRREKIAAGREQQRNFRRGAGAAGLGAGAAAVLGGILGLSNMGKEEEQQY